MEPIFVKVKVSELKKYLQVRGISVANNVAKNFGICLWKLLNLPSKSYTSKEMGISGKLVKDDEIIPDPYWNCCGDANIEGIAGFNLVGTRPPSK